MLSIFNLSGGTAQSGRSHCSIQAEPLLNFAGRADFAERRTHAEISTDAKLLYGLLLDRMELSYRNGWIDEQNRVFIIFTAEEVMDTLRCRSEKAARLFSELDSTKGIGLIERKRQGLGRPTLIYVKNFSGA